MDKDAGTPAVMTDAGSRTDAMMMVDTDAGPVDAGPPPGRGPYFTSGQWHGYFWIATHADGTTLATTNYDAMTFVPPVCMHGVVAVAKDNTGNAILGVNLNQASDDGDTLPGTVAPTHAGIRVDVSNRAGSQLRVQVQAPDGAENDRARWCALVNGSGGFIPWTQFNTACWDDSGTPYHGEAISGAMLLVPGTSDVAVPYDVCWSALAEADQ